MTASGDDDRGLLRGSTREAWPGARKSRYVYRTKKTRKATVPAYYVVSCSEALLNRPTLFSMSDDICSCLQKPRVFRGEMRGDTKSSSSSSNCAGGGITVPMFNANSSGSDTSTAVVQQLQLIREELVTELREIRQA